MHLQALTKAALAKLDKEQATLAQSVINGVSIDITAFGVKLITADSARLVTCIQSAIVQCKGNDSSVCLAGKNQPCKAHFGTQNITTGKHA